MAQVYGQVSGFAVEAEGTKRKLALAESAGKLLTQINELFIPSLWKEEGF